MGEPSILQLIIGPVAEGEIVELADLELADVLARLDTVDLTTPVRPYSDQESRFLDEVRSTLRATTMPEFTSRGPLTTRQLTANWINAWHMGQYIEPDHQYADRIYVLEFQGPWQYVMFGHTTNLPHRIIEHQRAANPHGFAMLNGWASPWLSNAQPLEQEALLCAGLLYGIHHRERFFEMPYEVALTIARIVVEKSVEWQSRSNLAQKPRVTSSGTVADGSDLQ